MKRILPVFNHPQDAPTGGRTANFTPINTALLGVVTFPSIGAPTWFIVQGEDANPRKH